MRFFAQAVLVSVIVSFAGITHASVSFVSQPVWFSDASVTQGANVVVSTVVTKTDASAVRGTVSFFANGKSIGSADFSLPPEGRGAVVSVSFVPEPGEYAVTAQITKAVVENTEDVAVREEVKASEKLVVVPKEEPTKISLGNGQTPTSNGSVTESNPLLPSVAGASTTVAQVLTTAQEVAGPVSERAFETTESWREKGKEYFDAKVAASNVHGFGDASDESLSSNPKASVMGIGEMVQAYLYQAGAFIFGNVYAFYIFFILCILWILRKIWRRYSLD